MVSKLDLTVRQWSAPTVGAVDDMLFHLTSCVTPEDIEDAQALQNEWAFCIWVMDYVTCARFQCLPLAVFQRLAGLLQEVVHNSRIGRLLTWKRRMDEAHQPACLSDDPASAHRSWHVLEPMLNPLHSQFEILDSLFHGCFSFSTKQGVPTCLFEGRKVIWILHLFSGRRRIGDVHWWLSHIGAFVLPGFEVRLISVDTAIDDRFGDLSTGPNLSLLLRMARRGIFAAVLTGPPCETFSAARHLDLHQDRGPRPLRSAQSPWCLPDRTAREYRQCDTGTELLMNSPGRDLRCQIRRWRTHGTSMENNDTDKVSVWRLRCHDEWFMRLRDSHRHRVEQWLYGARGIKPTCLRTANLGPPDIVGRALWEGTELWRSRPSTGLRGRGADGKYLTAYAKEYPSALCRSLIVAVLKGLRFRLDREGAQDPAQMSAEELTWVVRMSHKAEDLALDTFLPDYQRA